MTPKPKEVVAPSVPLPFKFEEGTIPHVHSAPKKIAIPRPSNPGDEKHLGSEPVWDTARAMLMLDDEFDHHLRSSLNYYNYFYSSKDLKKIVVSWLENSTKTPPDVLAAYKASPDGLTPITLCSIVRAHTVGMPLKEKHADYVFNKIEEIVKEFGFDLSNVGPTNPAAKKEGYRPTIQDRIAEKLAAVLGEIEGEIDQFYTKKTSKFKLFDYLTKNGVSAASTPKIVELLQKHIAELSGAETDADLKEAYDFLSKKERKELIEKFQAFINDAEMFSQAKKTQRKARAPKAPNKEKQVAKLKFLGKDDQLKLVSINPVDILGATELYVYDTKRRKLGVYVADAHIGALGVKGASIVGFDEVKSACKTLRKPAEQLRDFMKTTKTQARKFLKDIKAVETRLSGRISGEVLLLKVA